MGSETCELHFVTAETVRRLRARFVPEEQLQHLAETFRTLGDPTRAKIIFVLSQQALCVCDLAAVVGMSPSAVSHQLRVLRQMRLVKVNRAGRAAFYSLDDDHIVNLFTEGLRHVQEQVPSEQAQRLLRSARRAAGGKRAA